MKNAKAIELLEDIEDKLKAILSHRDCTRSLWSYIKASILTDDFYTALQEERSAEVIKTEPSELYKMFTDGNFGEVEGKTLYYEKELSNDKTKWELTVYHRDTEHPMNSGVLLYDSVEDLDIDLITVVLDFKFHLVDEGVWANQL